ncbi:MAG: hypothetical protein KA314_04610 [Chloroflexi bacterium]|nr:hypothetical protein [Chloroflexota bacterium]
MKLSKLIREYQKKIEDCATVLKNRSAITSEERLAINARKQAYVQIVHDLEDVDSLD